MKEGNKDSCAGGILTKWKRKDDKKEQEKIKERTGRIRKKDEAEEEKAEEQMKVGTEEKKQNKMAK